jgi:hypothetical protein
LRTNGKNIVAAFLAFQLAFSPFASFQAQAAAPSIENRTLQFSPAFDGQEGKGLGWFMDGKDATAELPKTNTQKLAEYGYFETIQKYSNFYEESKQKFADLMAIHGFEKLKTWMNDGVENVVTEGEEGIVFVDPELGRMRFTLVDDRPVARVVHKASGVSFIFAEKSLIKGDSQHLDYFMARQNFDSGRTKNHDYIEQDGKVKKIREGRDSLLIWVEKDKEVAQEDVVHHVRHKPGSKDWWKRWWKATYKKPEKYNVITGVTFGLIQLGTGYLVSGLTVGAMYGANMASEAMGNGSIFPDPGSFSVHLAGWLSLAFGTVIGTYNTTYTNLRGRGPAWRRMMKSASVSVAFAVTLRALSDAGFSSINVLDLSMGILPWIALAQIAQNITANNYLKTGAYQWADIKSAAGLDNYNFTLRVPYARDKNPNALDHKGEPTKYKWWEWETPLKQSHFNREVYSYLPVNSLRLFDLLIFGSVLSAMNHADTEGSAPMFVAGMSMWFMWMMVPLAFKYMKYWGLQKDHGKHTAKIRKAATHKIKVANSFEEVNHMPDHIGQWGANQLKKLGTATKNITQSVCSRILGK